MTPAAQKRGVSVKNVALFVLILLGACLFCSALPHAMLEFRMGYETESARIEAEREQSSNGESDIPSDTNRIPIASSLPMEETVPVYDEAATLPAGTYQVIIGRSRVVSSIRLYENSSEYEDVWYCDVITWGGGPDIADNYYGPATVTDDLQTIICGDYTFSINENGEPYFNDVLSEMSYGITYYSDDISMETGLNALIDMGNLAGNTLTQYAIDNYVETYGLDPSLLIDTER